MHFDLVDAVVERSAEHIVTIKQVSSAEEYLQDHFPSFPVLPGVMMLEAMVQAGRKLLSDKPGGSRLVLGGARALKYGRFVKPGQILRVTVTLGKQAESGAYDLRGEATVHDAGSAMSIGDDAPVAVSGRFTLRPISV